MLWAMEKRYSHVKNYHSFEVLPGKLKTKLNISSEFFKKEDINFIVSHQGNLNYKIFDHVYCSTCKRTKFQCFSKNIKKIWQIIPKEMILQMMGIFQMYHLFRLAWVHHSLQRASQCTKWPKVYYTSNRTFSQKQ